MSYFENYILKIIATVFNIIKRIKKLENSLILASEKEQSFFQFINLTVDAKGTLLE